MPSIKDYIELIVPEYIPMALTTALLGFVVANQKLPGNEFAIILASLFLVVAGFNAFNAISDAEIDRINKPNRPVPSQRITLKQALWFSLVCYGLSLILAIFINWFLFLTILTAIFITALYSWPDINLKRRFLIGSLTVTVFYAILCPIAGWSLNPTQPFPLAVIGFLFLLGSGLSISKDFMDVPGDSYNNAQTIPVKIGRNKSILIITLLLLLAFGSLVFFILNNYLNDSFYVLLVFLPLFLLSIYRFKSANMTVEESDHLFKQIIVLLILVEIAMIVLKLI